MVALTRRRVHEQASTLVRLISIRCQIRIEGNQVSGEPLSFLVGCTAQKYFHANISAVHVTASSAKFISRENLYVYGSSINVAQNTMGRRTDEDNIALHAFTHHQNYVPDY